MDTREIMAGVTVGLVGRAELTVGHRDLADHIQSGEVPVLATPVVLKVIEMACVDAIRGTLPAGYQSLGTGVTIRHFAATPQGMRVFAEATVRSVHERTITFYVKVRDEREPIAGGSLERVVSKIEPFIRRVEAKRSG